MRRYDSDTLRTIKERLPLSQYIRNYMDVIQKKDKLFSICPFHHENTPSFMVDPVEQRYYCFGCHCSGDIFAFIMKMDNISFYEAVEKAASLTGQDIHCSSDSSTLSFLKRFDKKASANIITHEPLSKSVYDSYDNWIEESWVNEGVPSDMFGRYEIKIDRKNNRVIYPVYDTNGNFINIKGRTRYSNFKERGVPKYINYYKVGGLDYLQGLHLTRNEIIKKKEIIVFEGVKSCMKAEGYGFHNVVSAETSSLTLNQIELLLSLQVAVVIAFDKDKTLNDFCNKNLRRLRQFAPLYYIDDVDGLLGDASEKNSPVDLGMETWIKLYESRKEVKK